MKQNNRFSGFTLVELLISMLIVSILGGAVFASFSQGIRIWQRAVQQSELGDEEFFFETIRSELRNAFVYDGIAFEGQSEKFDFYGLMSRQIGKASSSGYSKVPAHIQYRFLPSEKSIQKEVTFYEKMLDGKREVSENKIVLDKVENVKFEYDKRQKERFGSVWMKSWKDSCFPGAIKATMQLTTGLSAAAEVRIINIPNEGECRESKSE